MLSQSYSWGFSKGQGACCWERGVSTCEFTSGTALNAVTDGEGPLDGRAAGASEPPVLLSAPG